MRLNIRIGGGGNRRDTNLPGVTGGGPADIAKKMIRKVGVQKGAKPPKNIGVSKKGASDAAETGKRPKDNQF